MRAVLNVNVHGMNRVCEAFIPLLDQHSVLDQRSSVLLIPNRALDEDEAGNTIVHVVIDEDPQARSVTIGVSDGFDTEILSGLTEGEMVIETRIVR